jgi:TonB family protein
MVTIYVIDLSDKCRNSYSKGSVTLGLFVSSKSKASLDFVTFAVFLEKRKIFNINKLQMRNFCLSVVLLLTSGYLVAQLDSTIYDIVEQGARFPACEQLDTTLAAKQQCSQQALLAVIYQNVQYPAEARMEGIEGTVAVSFVVEPDSTISNANVLRDIGGGCGDAVLNVINAMNPTGIKWIPAKKDGQDVRSRLTIPIKFKLSEAPAYYMMGSDTVYSRYDQAAMFKGEQALEEYITTTLQYPELYEDSCLVGYMDVQLLVQPDGVIETVSVSDYLDLGLDFQMEVVNLTTSMFGKWEAAKYQERSVPTTVDLRMGFIPSDTEGCKSELVQFEQANALAVESIQLYEAEDMEGSITKITEALALQPRNAEYLALRGQSYVDLERYGEACQDLFLARQVLGTSSFDQLLMIICRMEKEGEETTEIEKQ